MSWKPLRTASLIFVIVLCWAGAAYAQREQLIQPPQPPDEAQSQYGRKFFVQLRALFGRFRDSDLQRAFERAQPIQCSELVNDKGEWRTVAFFNERRDLGDWYRRSLDEVKNDLSAFVFKGVCRGEHGPVQLTTKFPVTETVDAFNEQRIGLNQIEVNVNAPVRASFDFQSNAYAFDLPYLFLVSRNEDGNIYSLAPPRLAERSRYATDVLDHWECKSITAENVTYQFLICRTTTQSRLPSMRNITPAFGASAYFILSDGQEASSDVKLTFTDADDTQHKVEDASIKIAETPAVPERWEAPDADEKLLDVARDEFRIRFNAQTWAGRKSAAAVVSGQQLVSLASFTPVAGADYCVWLPGPASSSGGPEGYSVSAHDRDGQSATSITFQIKTASDERVGALQCFFPRASTAVSVVFDRWRSIVGPHLALEVRP